MAKLMNEGPHLKMENYPRRISSLPGCVFQYHGRIPEEQYKMVNGDTFQSPLEQAVYDNDIKRFRQLLREGHTVTPHIKIGAMSCLEYAAMCGYADILGELLSQSVNFDMLNHYFSQKDHFERATLISKHKHEFFEKAALTEVNRYEAALYAAIIYNKPKCLQIMKDRLGPRREHDRYDFFISDTEKQCLNAEELAHLKGFMECYSILLSKID